jgi:redox-sensitive bicupin YhaK (pirin superfamily)
MTQTNVKQRTIARLFPALRTTEGAGVTIRRGFPTAHFDDVDPFLLFDHLGPLDFAPGQAQGFPDHPHRGFETVTYLLEGQFEHRDSFGNHGVLGPGDVQWMTAGSGLVHSEMPGSEIVKNGGRLEGFQIWVNLPKRDKMKAPQYQELKAAEIPQAKSPDGKVVARVVAGKALGVTGAVTTHIPILYVHYTLEPGGEVLEEVSRDHNAIAYVIRGEAAVGEAGQSAQEGRMAVFAHDGEGVRIANRGSEPVDVLLLAGQPIGEPVVRYGPFVMNTKQELYEAFEDFRSGKMGVIG